MRFDFHHFVHTVPDAETERYRRDVLGMLNVLLQRGLTDMHTLQDTLAAVEATRGKVESLIAAILGLRQQIKDHVPDLSTDQQAALDKIFDEVSAAGEEIDAAINADPEPGASQPVDDAIAAKPEGTTTGL